MKYRMLDLVCCPKCCGELKLIVFERESETQLVVGGAIHFPLCRTVCEYEGMKINNGITLDDNSDLPNCSQCYVLEIMEGLLTCKCGNVYPIIEGVPRFLEGNLRSFPDFVNRHRVKLEDFAKNHHLEGKEENYYLPTEYETIHESFSKEWSLFEYGRDKTWGWDTEARIKVFLKEMGLEPSQFSGRLLLDAGCGNGILTALLTNLGMETVGLDLSDSVSRANSHRSKFAGNRSSFVHFIQGNLSTPPLKRNSFDIVYSSGVLHHCPDTNEAFQGLVPLVKQEGRLYVWVYGKRDLLVRAFLEHGRFLRRLISLKALYYYCRGLSPLYKIGTKLLSNMGLYEFRNRTTKEITVDLFDAFSPKYNHCHGINEVTNWFSQSGFVNITGSGFSKHGVGVRGDRVHLWKEN